MVYNTYYLDKVVNLFCSLLVAGSDLPKRNYMNSTATATNSTEIPESTEGKWIKKWMSEPKYCVPHVVLGEIKLLVLNIFHFFIFFLFPHAVILNNCSYYSMLLVYNMNDKNRKTPWSSKITRAMEIFKKIIFISVFRRLNARMPTALFTNMRILKFKSQLTIALFAAVNHLKGPPRKQNFTLTGSKGHGFWFVIDGFRRCLSS